MKALFRRTHAASHSGPGTASSADESAPLSYAEAKAARERSLASSSPRDALGSAGPFASASSSSYPSAASTSYSNSSKRSSGTPRPAEALRELRSRWRSNAADPGAGSNVASQGRQATPRRGQGPSAGSQPAAAAPPTSWRPPAPQSGSGLSRERPPSPILMLRPKPTPTPSPVLPSSTGGVAAHQFGDMLSAAVAAEEAALPRSSAALHRPTGDVAKRRENWNAPGSSPGPATSTTSRSRSPFPMAPPSPSISPSNSHPNHVGQASTPSAMPTPTPSLAAELNELAVAHADGLLADDEYRALRTALFERMGEGGLRIPREAEVTGFATLPIGLAVGEDRPSKVRNGTTSISGVQQATSKSPYPPPAPSSRKFSLRSSASSLRSSTRTSVHDVASLFRRRGTGTSMSDREDEGGAGTTRSMSISGGSGRQSSLAGKRPSTLSLRRRGTGSGADADDDASAEERRRMFAERRANSLGISYHARASALGTSPGGAAPSSSSSVHGGSLGLAPPRPGSVSGRSASSQGAHSQSHSVGVGNGNGATSISGVSVAGPQPSSAASRDYTQKGSADISAELSVVEAEGQRVLESFNALAKAAVNRARATLDAQAIEKAVQGADPRVRELARLVGILGQDADKTSRNGTPSGGSTGRFASLAAAATWGRKRSLSTLQPGGTSSSQAPPRQASPHRSPNPDATTAKGDNHFRRASLPTSAASHALVVELGDVAGKRADVAKRYEDKLAFLRAMLRAARIREGLR